MRLVRREADPNDQRYARRGFEGIAYTPLSTAGHGRAGTYHRIRDVAARHPDRLRVELNALATRVILDENRRAIGVDYLKGAHLYRADPNPAASPGTPHRLRVHREVIVSGGAFNTPQLLMLSGIGAPAELAAHGIPVQIELPGVGRNLQDRYEIAVVNRLDKPWSSLDGARFDTPIRSTANGWSGGAACTSQTARRLPSLAGRRRTNRCRICSAWRCSRGSMAIFPDIRGRSRDHMTI